MGFSVTASHLIVVIAMLAAGGAAGMKGLDTYRDVQETERTAADRRADYAHTAMSVVTTGGYPNYQGGANNRYTVRIDNTGTTVLRASEMTFLIDGVYANLLIEAGYPTIEGSATIDLWMPGETLEVSFQPVTAAPGYFAAYAANGAAAYHRE